MPKAIDLIVDTCVKYNDRQSLDEMMAHRQKLATDLKSRPRSDYDFGPQIEQLDEDIATIAAGLEKVRAECGAAKTLSFLRIFLARHRHIIAGDLRAQYINLRRRTNTVPLGRRCVCSGLKS